MTHGGSRNRSGPKADPKSARSESRKLAESVVTLPSKGFTGRIPAWPLSRASAQERDVWKWAWRTPQAAQWAQEPWRHRTVALWVRWSVRSEDPNCSATAVTASIRLADQIGMTPAGLVENGWKISEDDVGKARASKAAAVAEEKPVPKRRLRAVPGGGS